jgi:hypothetical protein
MSSGDALFTTSNISSHMVLCKTFKLTYLHLQVLEGPSRQLNQGWANTQPYKKSNASWIQYILLAKTVVLLQFSLCILNFGPSVATFGPYKQIPDVEQGDFSELPDNLTLNIKVFSQYVQIADDWKEYFWNWTYIHTQVLGVLFHITIQGYFS